MPTPSSKKPSTDQESATQQLQEMAFGNAVRPPLWLWIILVAVALMSGLVGSFAINWYLAAHPNSSLSATQSKNIIVSEQNATIDIARRVGPSVVSITSSTTARTVYGNTTQEGAGTGIIITADGMILTNKHVVEGASSYIVTLSDGKEHQAKLLATDPINDIAFIKIEANGLTPATLGDSSKVEIGQFVVAIGNALGQFQNSVTTGVISGKSRPITAGDGQGSSEKLTNLFQTDAAINPGNSGGPLVNIDGQVIGMNTAVAGQGSQGLGFAIPVNDIKSDIISLKEKGKLVRAYIGVRYVPVTPSLAKANNLGVDYGALIYGTGQNPAVVPGGPAEKAGLKGGDIILKVNDTKIDSNTSITAAINQYKVGETITLNIFRDGKEQQLKLTLAEAPATL